MQKVQGDQDKPNQYADFNGISLNILNIFKTFNKNKYKNTYNDEADDPYIAQVLDPFKGTPPNFLGDELPLLQLPLDLGNLVLGKLYLEIGMMA